MRKKPDSQALEALQLILDAVNDHGSSWVRDKIVELFIRGDKITVPDVHVGYERKGDRIETIGSTDAGEASLLIDIIALANRVGATRVRRCPLPECEKFFVATHGRQRFCTYQHAAKAAYQTYRHKQRKEA